MNSEKRVKKIFSSLDKSVDAIFIKNQSESFIDPNFFYATEMIKGLFEGCAAVLHPSGKIDLLVSKLEEGLAKKTKHNVFVYNNIKEFNNILKNSLDNPKKIGINFDGVTYRYFKQIKEIFSKKEILDVSNGLIKSRMIKDDDEIHIIKKACKIADIVASKIPDICHEGMFEYELAAEIDYLLQKNGADASAFLTISSFGKNTSNPHYSHGNYKLKNGDFILCDFGARCNRYNSDITRTFIFGKPSEKQKKIYEAVLKAQKKGLEKIKPGIPAKIVHNTVYDFINKTEFKDLFIHSTGHSLGIEVHDGGVGFNSECDVKLEKNMVLTVEPGIYLSSLGGVRIEDDILINEDGFELLTKSSRNFIEI